MMADYLKAFALPLIMQICVGLGSAGIAAVAINARIEERIVHIEQRNPDEVTEMWYKRRMAPEGVKVYNPAFDVTDHELITAIVTEFGIARAPYTESLKQMMERKAEAGRQQ